jgi:hypothetical protein
MSQDIRNVFKRQPLNAVLCVDGVRDPCTLRSRTMGTPQDNEHLEIKTNDSRCQRAGWSFRVTGNVKDESITWKSKMLDRSPRIFLERKLEVNPT